MSTPFAALASLDGRYPSDEERAAALAFAESLPARLRSAQDVERLEDEMLRAVVVELQSAYPDLAKHHHQGWARVFRDLQLVLRQSVAAAIVGDPGLLESRFLIWMRTMLASNNLTPGFVREMVGKLNDQLRSRLSAAEVEFLMPMMTCCIEVLPNFPEPATPAV